MLYSIVGLLVIILDQAVKFWVSNTLFGTDVVRFIPGVISLVNVHNDGAAFSFLSGQGARIYFIIATGVFVLLVIIALATNFIRGKFARWCLVFVAAGGIANMIDRVIYGYVQDMFKVELFNFAIFNVADVFITVFSILFALAMIFERPETDMVDVLYEVDDEDERPEKAPRKKLFGKKDKAPEPAEDTGDAAAAAAPAKDSSVRSARKSRQEKYEQEYQEYKAQQRAAMGMKNAKDTRSDAVPPVSDALPEPSFDIPERRRTKPEPVPVPAAQPEADPYAAWDIANQKAQASLADSQTSRLMGAQKPVEPPKAAAAPAPRPAPAAKPAEPPKVPAPKSAPKPADSDSGDEFSLDDILAEFK